LRRSRTQSEIELMSSLVNYILKRIVCSFVCSLVLVQVALERSLAGSPATLFYKTPQSIFPSGQTNRAVLQKKLIGSEFHYDYLIQANNRSQWVSSELIAKDQTMLDLVRFRSSNYFLREIRGAWALIESEKSPIKKDWVPISDITAHPLDKGIVLTLITTALREKPTWTSASILSVPAKTRLQIVKLEETWLLVKFSSGNSSSLGYVDMNNVLLKSDFASHVLTPKGNWEKVEYREGSQLVLTNKKTLALQEVKSIKTRTDLGCSFGITQRKKSIITTNSKNNKTRSTSLVDQ
jgi:hypothetical protein